MSITAYSGEPGSWWRITNRDGLRIQIERADPDHITVEIDAHADDLFLTVRNELARQITEALADLLDCELVPR